MQISTIFVVGLVGRDKHKVKEVTSSSLKAMFLGYVYFGSDFGWGKSTLVQN